MKYVLNFSIFKAWFKGVYISWSCLHDEVCICQHNSLYIFIMQSCSVKNSSTDRIKLT